MNGRALGVVMVVVATAVAACSGDGGPVDAALTTSGVTEACLGARAELRACIDRGWNRAECEAAFRDDRAVRGLGDECAPNASCADVRAWYRTCVDDGGDAFACEDRFYTDREENFVASECAPVASCTQLRAELLSCLDDGEARVDCESAVADEIEGTGATCPIDDL
jgi:hypothetical protein